MRQRHEPSGHLATEDDGFRRYRCRGCGQPVTFSGQAWRTRASDPEWCPADSPLTRIDPGPGDPILNPHACDRCQFTIEREHGVYTSTGAVHLVGECEKPLTVKEIADAIAITPRSKEIKVDSAADMCELRGLGSWNKAVLAVLSNAGHNKMPPGPRKQRCMTVAYALYKAIMSGRLCGRNAVIRITWEYTLYQVCEVIARIARDCPSTTAGAICDIWICQHHDEL